MPLYTFECPYCGTRRDVARTIAERDDTLLCPNPKCDDRGEPSLMERVPTAASFKVEGFSAKNGYTK